MRAGVLLVMMLVGCSRELGTFGDGESCVRSGECRAGLACVSGMCTTDLSGLEGGTLPPRPMDAGRIADAGRVDAGRMIDAGPFDAGRMMDAGRPMDAGRDAGQPMLDAGRDAGQPMLDAGRDAGPLPDVDAGPPP